MQIVFPFGMITCCMNAIIHAITDVKMMPEGVKNCQSVTFDHTITEPSHPHHAQVRQRQFFPFCASQGADP
jgi:hypothetical protein